MYITVVPAHTGFAVGDMEILTVRGGITIFSTTFDSVVPDQLVIHVTLARRLNQMV